jgi:hypothetical protein
MKKKKNKNNKLQKKKHKGTNKERINYDNIMKFQLLLILLRAI